MESVRQATLPLSGNGCIGSLHLTGSKESVEAMMAKLHQFVKNELYVEWQENRVPHNAKPAPCNGCGN